MSKLVVSGVVRDEEAFLVAGGGSSNDSGTTNSGLDDWDEGAQLRLKDAVEVIGTTRCY